MTALKENFQSVLSAYSSTSLIATYWEEVLKHYNDRSRHYHSMQHLENMFSDLNEVRSNIRDWNAIIIALVYHDIIYKPLSGTNEEESASLASRRLHHINVPAEKIEKIEHLILATKKHIGSADDDVNYFLDADLAIFGKGPDLYDDYATAVRREFSIVPDFVYKPGRKKVLNHFLSMHPIFKTDFFRNRFAEQAKINLERELRSL